MENIAPPRSPLIGQPSRVLHQSGRYVVSLTRAGLVVQHHASGTGRLLPRAHSQFGDYVDAFETAIDSKESDALARALITP